MYLTENFNRVFFLLSSIQKLTIESNATVIIKTLPAAVNALHVLKERVSKLNKINNEIIFLNCYIEQFSIAAGKIVNDVLMGAYKKNDVFSIVESSNDESTFFFEALNFFANVDVKNNDNGLLNLDDDVILGAIRSMRNYQRSGGSSEFISLVKNEFDSHYDKQIQYYTGRLDAIVKDKEDDFLSLKKSVVEFDENYSSRLDELSKKAEASNNELAQLTGMAQALLDSSEGIHSGLNRKAMADAFEQMAKSLIVPISTWAIVFILTLLSIFGIGIYFYSDSSSGLDTAILLSRIFIISPLVWLAWFSGRQYGHAYKMRQDYRYKDAVAKAYHGYKTETGNEHGEMHAHLLKNIIEHFSDNPVRLYDKCEPSMPIEEFLKKISPEHILDIWKTTQNKNKEQSDHNMKPSK